MTINTALAFFAVLGIALASDYGDIRNLNHSNTGTKYPAPAYRNLADWNLSRTRIRQQILSAAGLQPMLPRTPLNIRREVAVTRPSYIVERVSLEILPGYRLAGNLYLPARPRSRRNAAVLIPQGHWKHGRVEHRPDYSTPTFGANLAAHGFVAFAYDMVGYNELDALPHEFGRSPQEQLWSFSPLGLQLWSGIRAMDFLTGLAEVDPRRIAVTGASGGATQTLLLAAVDDRVAASAPVVMVSDEFQGDDACEMAPGLRMGSNNVEISAVFAPKPQLLVSATHDWTKHTPEREFPSLRSVYKLFGRETLVSFEHIDAPHNFNRQSREAVMRFLQKHFGRRSHSASWYEREIFDAPPEVLLHRQNPKPDPTELEALFARWRALTGDQAEKLDPVTRPAAIREATGLAWPHQVRVLKTGKVNLLERDNSGERVPFVWLPGSGGQTALVVHLNGSAAARRDPETREWLDGERPVLLLDVFQTGEATTSRAPLRGDYLTYHSSDDTNRVQDILTALAFLARDGESVRLICPGQANVWCALAAVLAQTRVDFTPTPWTRNGSEEELLQKLFIPGLQRAGGIATIRRWTYRQSRSDVGGEDILH